MTSPMHALAVIGGGNMAQAIVRGGLDDGLLAPNRVVVAEPDDAKRELLRQWGVRVVQRGAEAIGTLPELEQTPGAGQVMLAVKPQMLPDVAADLQRAPAPADPRVVISILAGAPSATVRAVLGDWARVVRVMPNLPARVRKGTTAVALGEGATPGDEAGALALFRAVGEVVSIDETLMDAFTALAGSGPAYVFLLAEAMVEGARRVGLDESTADTVARATIAGAAELLTRATETPGELRRAVTSTGGTTAAALAVFDEHDMKGITAKAIEAARDRGAELARLAQG